MRRKKLLVCATKRSGPISHQGIGKKIRGVLEKMCHINFPDPAIRLEEHLPYAPRTTMLVDTFPVRIRSDGSRFNPKYGCKVLKFQLTVTLRGQPQALEECFTSTINDGAEL
jgi:hypothetical protein